MPESIARWLHILRYCMFAVKCGHGTRSSSSQTVLVASENVRALVLHQKLIYFLMGVLAQISYLSVIAAGFQKYSNAINN